MMSKTKFYNLLKTAKENDTSLLIIINKLKPLIKSNSLVINEDDGSIVYNEDLESKLIEYVIRIIKLTDIADILAS